MDALYLCKKGKNMAGGCYGEWFAHAEEEITRLRNAVNYLNEACKGESFLDCDVIESVCREAFDKTK